MRASEELIVLFRARGLRVTPQRERVFEILHAMSRSGKDVHPTAEALWGAAKETLPTVSLKTIYDILHELVSLGEIHQIDLGTGARVFEIDGTDHHHFVCDACGRIINLALDVDHMRLEPDAGDRFQVSDIEVKVRGLCSDCLERRG